MPEETNKPPWPERPTTVPDEQRAPRDPQPQSPPWVQRPSTVEHVEKGGLEPGPKRDPGTIEKA